MQGRLITLGLGYGGKGGSFNVSVRFLLLYQQATLAMMSTISTLHQFLGVC